MLIIGSYALHYHLQQLNKLGAYREPKDLDVLVANYEFESLKRQLPATHKFNIISSNHMIIHDFRGFKNVEVHTGSKGTSNDLYLNLPENYQTYKQTCDQGMPGMSIASLSTLFSIKKSHIHFPRMFKKHIQDYHILKQIVGEDRLSEITKQRFKETEAHYGKLKTPSLDKSAKDFFNDNVSNRLFIHDEIHKIMAYNKGYPLYEKIKKDTSKVSCDKDKFFALSEVDQLHCVLEEAYVIALERKILPMLFSRGSYSSPDEAMEYALMRICTTLCSGWFRDFATNNYFKLLSEYNLDYVFTFLLALEAEEIKRIDLEKKDETIYE